MTILKRPWLLGAPIINVENACASASTAFHLAVSAVASGQVEVALAVGAEKLTHPDKSRSFEAIGTAVDLATLDDLLAWTHGGADEPRREDAKRSLFMDIYAANARGYMQRSGATRDDFARVAVKSHHHASLNPDAQYRQRVTADEVLASRVVSSPLTLLMCSPIGDGAAALVVTTLQRARTLDAHPVTVRGSVLVSGTDRAPGEPTSVERAASLAYQQAGIGPQDLAVIELHDAAAPAELITYEELALCGEGDGAALLRSGRTRLGGDLVVNPSGGLLSKGHPIGATGCAQLVELTNQLRGRCGARQVAGARIALAENAGGFLGNDNAATAIIILSG